MIGKTRQKPDAQVEEIFDPEVGRARGMLKPRLTGGKMRHSRRRPSADLVPWIAHYWIINWDLRDCAPQIVESLPHPNVHLVFENGDAIVCGVQTHKFSRVLEGKSHVFGVKFRPGGFRPFFIGPVSKLADRVVPASRIFGKDIDALKEIVLSACGENNKVHAANTFFHARMPKDVPSRRLAEALVDQILRESEIKTVDHLVIRTGMGKRSLQRLFSEYVGASPKWVIRRYRLHEVIEQSNSSRKLDWSQVALDLGYFDQAHLINDFKSIVGLSPSEYQKMIAKHS
jgi:AraC-like DNA-binding protein